MEGTTFDTLLLWFHLENSPSINSAEQYSRLIDVLKTVGQNDGLVYGNTPATLVLGCDTIPMLVKPQDSQFNLFQDKPLYAQPLMMSSTFTTSIIKSVYIGHHQICP